MEVRELFEHLITESGQSYIQFDILVWSRPGLQPDIVST